MCINCNSKVVDEIFEISGRNYGSNFDSENIKISLCHNCINELNLKPYWFENLLNNNDEYLYEDELENLLNRIGVDKISLTNICSSNIIKLQNKKAGNDMGKYYLFKVRITGNDIEQVYKQIDNDNVEYIAYDKFLIKYYGTTIVENEDYIAYVNKNTATMILSEDCFDKYELGNVFDILYDSLYSREEKYEENSCC